MSEAQIIDLGAVSYSRTIVSLYDSYDQATALFVLAHSESRVCFTTASHLAALLSRSEEVPLLKCIVLLDSIPRRSGEETLARQWAETRGIHLVSYAGLLELGRKHPFKHNPPTNNRDVTTYCYTSGTTVSSFSFFFTSNNQCSYWTELLPSGHPKSGHGHPSPDCHGGHRVCLLCHG